MCGISGLLVRKSFVHLESQKAQVDGMLSKIFHRGPDGQGIESFDLREWTLVLGHRRLAIIDLAGGYQPMRSGKLSITFNGEILNYQELKKNLDYNFKTSSDTEVILASFEKSREESFKELNGFFSFGLFDENDQSLHLCRDRFGIKPLYYSTDHRNYFAFASELTSLLSLPFIEKRLNEAGLAQYFFQSSYPWEYSAIQGIEKVLPGEKLTWRNGRIEKSFYFDPATLGAKRCDDSFDEAKRKTRQLIKQAVSRHMISDVPLGVFLSGGIDSSIIAYEGSHLTNQSLKTFSIGFDRPDYDESSYARKIAAMIGSHHHEEIIGTADMAKELPNVISVLDEPLGDSSIIPSLLVSRMARKKVTVALGGDGGDELFGGYPILRAHELSEKWAPLIKLFRQSGAVSFLRMLKNPDKHQSLQWKLKKFFIEWDADPLWRHQKWQAGLKFEPLGNAFKTEFLKNILGDQTLQGFLKFKRLKGSFDPNQYLLMDLMNFLANDVITKADRASMASGLELRPPFLDNDLAEYAFSLPFSYKYRNGEKKYLLKEAYRGELPDDILYRPKKGFSVPMPAWMAGALSEQMRGIVEESPLTGKSGPLSREFWRVLLKKHVDHSEDNAVALWNLYVLHHWHLKTIG
jgi:asparagine synthase (glutamine-hydrolysing)